MLKINKMLFSKKNYDIIDRYKDGRATHDEERTTDELRSKKTGTLY